jgi:hypothetical protein
MRGDGGGRCLENKGGGRIAHPTLARQRLSSTQLTLVALAL